MGVQSQSENYDPEAPGNQLKDRQTRGEPRQATFFSRALPPKLQTPGDRDNLKSRNNE